MRGQKCQETENFRMKYTPCLSLTPYKIENLLVLPVELKKNASFKYVKFANCTFISSQNFRAQNLHCWLGQCRENHNFIPIFDEWSGSHISNHWLKCRRSCVEKCPFHYVGFRRTRITQSSLEHLLLKHRSNYNLI